MDRIEQDDVGEIGASGLVTRCEGLSVEASTCRPVLAGDLLDQAQESQDAEELERQEAAAAERAKQFTAYVALLNRSEEPEPGDAEKLAAVLAALGKTIEDARRDRDTLQSADLWVERHLDRHAANEAVQEALQRKLKYEAEARAKLKELDAEFRRERARASNAGHAGSTLREMFDQSPELFAGHVVEGLPASLRPTSERQEMVLVRSANSLTPSLIPKEQWETDKKAKAERAELAAIASVHIPGR